MSWITVLLVAIALVALGFIFGIALGIFIGVEIKINRDKKRRS